MLLDVNVKINKMDDMPAIAQLANLSLNLSELNRAQSLIPVDQLKEIQRTLDELLEESKVDFNKILKLGIVDEKIILEKNIDDALALIYNLSPEEVGEKYLDTILNNSYRTVSRILSAMSYSGIFEPNKMINALSTKEERTEFLNKTTSLVAFKDYPELYDIISEFYELYYFYSYTDAHMFIENIIDKMDGWVNGHCANKRITDDIQEVLFSELNMGSEENFYENDDREPFSEFYISETYFESLMPLMIVVSSNADAQGIYEKMEQLFISDIRRSLVDNNAKILQYFYKPLIDLEKGTANDFNQIDFMSKESVLKFIEKHSSDPKDEDTIEEYKKDRVSNYNLVDNGSNELINHFVFRLVRGEFDNIFGEGFGNRAFKELLNNIGDAIKAKSYYPTKNSYNLLTDKIIPEIIKDNLVNEEILFEFNIQ